MSAGELKRTGAIIPSILWTDWYKVTMCQAVFMQYSRVIARYKFYDRGGLIYPPGFAARVREEISLMADLFLTLLEQAFIAYRTGHYITPSFLDWFRHFRFKPEQVTVTQQGAKLFIFVEGPWFETIMWEVPLLLIVSTLYHEMTGQMVAQDWFSQAFAKGKMLAEGEVAWVDFSTRRAYSPEYHEQVLIAYQDATNKHAKPGKGLIGTSNPYLAMKYGLTPYGTHAHEWFQAHAAMFGYRMANEMALAAWERQYEGYLGIYLYDTFGSEAGRAAFGPRLARLFDGVRQDSGDPIAEADMWYNHYLSLRIDPTTKIYLPSDSLDGPKAIAVTQHCAGKLRCLCGIGGWIGNGEGIAVKPNIVIKLDAIKMRSDESWRNCVKLSNASGKATGDPYEIETAKRVLGIVNP